MTEQELILWSDLETNGDDPLRHKPLEIAVVVTDENLTVHYQAEHLIHYSDDEVVSLLEDAIPSVRQLHYRTGIWEAVSQGLPLLQVDETLSEALQTVGVKNSILGGNSVHFDRGFIRQHFPQTYSHLGYQILDVSSIRKFFSMTLGTPRMEKQAHHKALPDIRETILEMRYYQNILRKLAGSDFSLIRFREAYSQLIKS